MGMDVLGRNPSSKAGEYFRANVWSWRPIQALIVELCSDLLDDDTLTGLSFNSGYGPKEQTTCSEMANRFDQWMEHHVSGHTLESESRVTREGRFVSPQEQAANPELETVSAYETDDDHLKEWIEFLRNCGGFSVC